VLWLSDLGTTWSLLSSKASVTRQQSKTDLSVHDIQFTPSSWHFAFTFPGLPYRLTSRSAPIIIIPHPRGCIQLLFCYANKTHSDYVLALPTPYTSEQRELTGQVMDSSHLRAPGTRREWTAGHMRLLWRKERVLSCGMSRRVTDVSEERVKSSAVSKVVHLFKSKGMKIKVKLSLFLTS
jgi:hypothetical protein